MTKEKNLFRKSNRFSIFLKCLAIFFWIFAILIGISYGAESGGVSTFAICFIVGLTIFAIFYAIGEALAILHDIRNKLYEKGKIK